MAVLCTGLAKISTNRPLLLRLKALKRDSNSINQSLSVASCNLSIVTAVTLTSSVYISGETS
jgi:hypothetical protein